MRRRSPRATGFVGLLPPRRSFALLLLACLVGTACGGGGKNATRAPSAFVAPARENVAYFYQRVTSTTDLSRLGDVKLVVAGPQQDDPSAAARIKATGATAYRYVQSYWFPKGSSFDGLDIGAHPDWAFCASGSTPLAGRTTGSGTVWWFLDMNEQPVHQFFLDKFRALKAAGWDGVFLDRGFASLAGDSSHEIDKVSTCTGQPVTPGATFADAYVGIMAVAKQAGVPLIINYGISPFDAHTPLRSDAWNVLSSSGLVLDEAVSHPRDSRWAADFAVNLQNEQNSQHGGRVIGLLTTATIGTQNRQNVYYGWTRVKLFAIPLGVNTGDAGCANTGGLPCNQHGLYPELANVGYGPPLSTRPESTQCASGDAIHCLWFRRYEQGISLLNVSPSARTGVIPLGVSGCRYVLDLYTNRSIDGGHCVTSVSVSLGPWEGHPLEYGTKPF
jgi:hypothetical protein